MTFDEKSGILFTADLFGSFSKEWGLFMSLDEECRNCGDFESCSRGMKHCPIHGILMFHRKVMSSGKALRHAINIIRNIPCTMIAPQHGSVISHADDIAFVCGALENLDRVGIDGYLSEVEGGQS